VLNTNRPSSGDRWIFLIALFKLAKSLLLIAVAVGALGLLHKDVGEVLQYWIDLLRVDPDNRFIHTLLSRVWSVNEQTLKEVSAGTFCYAAVFMTEGTGLLLGKRWAKYLTMIVTSSFLPVEIYELVRHPGAMKCVVILLNAGIVAYLVIRVREE
jgi:uncharacterized membrane protein (DUF2068 family)